MRNYWVTSDTHFFHENIIRYCGRPFNSAAHMNEVLIENWNKVVKPGDYVYHLGDFWMGPSTHEERHKLINRLNGKKTLIVGNHDDIPYMCRGGWFRKVEMWKVMPEWNCLMTHVPVHESSIHERLVVNGGFNLHGHIHDNPSPPGPYKCVCVEQTNYTPVNLEEIRDGMK
jgi:calcineurin-like phosphoesterase family protein